MFLGIYPCFSGLFNVLAYICSIFYKPVSTISVVSVVTSLSFIILFILIFIFWCVSLKFINIIYLFNAPALGFIDLLYCFRLYFIYFHSDLYYFPPSTHCGLVYWYFSSSFRCQGWLLVWNLSCFFCCRPVLLWIFLLGLLLLMFHRLCVVVLPFLFTSRYLLIFPLISILTHSLFSNMLFSLHVFVCFQFFFFNWFLVSYLCDQRRCLMWFQCS